MFTVNSGNFDCMNPDRFHSLGYFSTIEEARAALQSSPNRQILNIVFERDGKLFQAPVLPN
jgi:hypothetical protein